MQRAIQPSFRISHFRGGSTGKELLFPVDESADEVTQAECENGNKVSVHFTFSGTNRHLQYAHPPTPLCAFGVCAFSA